MSWADYKSDIERLENELVAAKLQKANLQDQIDSLRANNLNRDALDYLARKKTFLSDPNELTIWLDR